jgi:amidase
MARTIADVTLLFEVLCGQDPLDPASPPVPLRRVGMDEARAVSIGWLQDDGLAPVTDETRAAVRSAADALERRGFRVCPYRPPSLESARQLWWTFFVQCGAMFYADMVRGREQELSPTFRGFFEIASTLPPLTAQRLLQAWADLDVVRGRLLAEMREYPILLTPVCSVPAFRHGERAWTVDGARVEYLDAMRYTQWFNMLASPAAVVPVGTSREGLPIGVQIAGRPFEDELVLAVSAVLDQDFGYRPPPIC